MLDVFLYFLDTGTLLQQQNAGCWKVTLFLAKDDF
jgi:hypothetical protein